MLVLHTSLTNCSFSQCLAKSNGANFEELKLTETLGQTINDMSEPPARSHSENRCQLNRSMQHHLL
jgi:hypothetical protein